MRSGRTGLAMIAALALAAAPGCDGGTSTSDAASTVDAASRDAGARADASLDAAMADTSVAEDASAPDALVATEDAFVAMDAPTAPDAYAAPDAWTAPDAYVAPDAWTAPDAYVAPDAYTGTICVDIFVSNTCVETVAPTSVTIPDGETPMFCWHNRSRDYPVDVWMSYGGGFTDLAPGATWNEPVRHCLGPNAHDEYADITTACSSFRFLIHCL